MKKEKLILMNLMDLCLYQNELVLNHNNDFYSHNYRRILMEKVLTDNIALTFLKSFMDLQEAAGKVNPLVLANNELLSELQQSLFFFEGTLMLNPNLLFLSHDSQVVNDLNDSHLKISSIILQNQHISHVQNTSVNVMEIPIREIRTRISRICQILDHAHKALSHFLNIVLFNQRLLYAVQLDIEKIQKSIPANISSFEPNAGLDGWKESIIKARTAYSINENLLAPILPMLEANLVNFQQEVNISKPLNDALMKNNDMISQNNVIFSEASTYVTKISPLIDDYVALKDHLELQAVY